MADAERWRRDWVASLGGAAPIGVSPALAALLLEVLGASAASRYRAYPYRLDRFPEDALRDPDALAGLHRVLLWRAGVVDFLADVWDTLGEADFTLDECRLVSEALMPASGTDAGVCALCLAPQAANHFDACDVQREWRARTPRTASDDAAG